MSEKTARQTRKQIKNQYSTAVISVINTINARIKRQSFIQRLKTCMKYLFKKEFEI